MSRPLGSKSIPTLCLHKASGRAYVTLDGKPVYLGRYGTPESREKYDRTISEWLGNDRKLPAPVVSTSLTTVAVMLAAFWRHAQEYYRSGDGTPDGELDHYKLALRPLRKLYSSMPLAEFGPRQMKTVLHAMVELGWCRKSINRHLSRLRHVFDWAAGEELITAEIANRVKKVKGLRFGKTKARESKPVLPVPEEQFKQTLPFLPSRIRSMVELQLLTGMRPGELCAMRVRDINTTGNLWIYCPSRHKTEHHGVKRSIPIGPKAREIVTPYMMTLNPDKYLFVPSDSEADRRANQTRQTPRQPSQIARAKAAARRRRKRPPGDHYDVAGYRRAISRACDFAFPLPADLARMRGETRTEWRTRLGDRFAEVEAWRSSHRWHPHRLRHNAASLIRELFGLEAAQAVLGHKSLKTTQIYAERLTKAAEQAMAQAG